MDTIAPATEDEMVLAFLAAEKDAERFKGWIQDALASGIGDDSLVEDPDLNDPEQNDARKRLLAAYRGYGHHQLLFKGLPRNIEWMRLSASVDEIGAMRPMNYPAFRALTGSSRLVRDGVANLDHVQVEEDLNNRIRGVAAAIARGQAFPPIVFVATSPSDVHVVIEGNTRAFAYVLKPPESGTIEVIAGYSLEVADWHWY